MIDRPMPFHEAMKVMNKRYYASREHNAASPKDRLGFPTPSHDPHYIRAHALEFIDYAKGVNGPLSVHEFGAADGHFAVGFLDYLRKNAPDVYDRTRYHAWEKSDGFVSAAQSALRKHGNAEAAQADVESFSAKGKEGTADWVYCHELLDDLPSRIVIKKGGVPKELWMKPIDIGIPGAMATQMEHEPLPKGDSQRAKIERFMEEVPDNVRVTIPVGALNAIGGIHKLLKKGGHWRVQDYGFDSPRSMVMMTALSPSGLGEYSQIFKDAYAVVGKVETKRSRGEGYVAGTRPEDQQLTTLVNFPFLEREAKEKGFDVKTEPMVVWARKHIGQDYSAGSHHAQGLAYALKEREKSTEGYTNLITSQHELFKPKGTLRGEVMKIVDREGDTPKALETAVQMLRDRGIDISMRRTPRKQEGEDYYVLNKVRDMVRGRVEDVVRRAKEKAMPVNELTVGLTKLDRSHEQKFEPEIRELKSLGVDEDAAKWFMFSEPLDYKLSAPEPRLTFTGVKK